MNKTNSALTPYNDSLYCPKCNSDNLSKVGISKGNKQYRCKDCGKYFDVKSSTCSVRDLPEHITPEEMKFYDVWDLRVFGKKPNSNGDYGLNFSNIINPWLKCALKEFIWYSIVQFESATLQDYLRTFRKVD